MKTHYDVLNLEKNCTSQEIKDSYIKLSKKYHPDKNKSSDAQKKFVAVNEAYSVLGKSDSRHRYDESLSYTHMDIMQRPESNGMRVQRMTYYEQMHRENINKNYGAYESYFNKSRFNTALLCCFVMLIGAGIQMKYAWNQKAQRDLVLERAIAHTRARAHRLGREQAIVDFARDVDSKRKGHE